MEKIWERMSTDEKLEALRTDVISAFNLSDDAKLQCNKLSKSLNDMDSDLMYKLGALAQRVFEIEQKMKKVKV